MQKLFDIPVFFEYKRILLEKISGSLLVSDGKLKKNIYFKNGYICSAESNSFDEKLGVIMNLLGIISESHYDYISGLINIRRDKLTEILLNEHLATKKELNKSLIYQARRIAVTSFSMTGSKWEFRSGEIPDKNSSNIRIPVTEIIYDGGRRYEVYDHLRQKFGFLSPKTFTGTSESRRTLNQEEIEMYKLIDENPGSSNREIISKGNISPEIYWKIISVLFLLGLIEFDNKTTDDKIEEDISALLKIKFRIKENEADIENILELNNGEPEEAFFEKFRKALEKFNPVRFGSALAPEIKKEAEFVNKKLKIMLKKYKMDREIKELAIPGQNIFNPEAKKEIPLSKRDEVLKKAERLYDLSHFDEAIPLLKDILKIRKDDFELILLLGKCQTNVQFFSDEAIRNLSKAIELRPIDPDPIFFLGEQFRKIKKIKKAIKCYKRVIEIEPNHFMAKRGILKLKEGIKKSKKQGFFRKSKKNI